MGLLRMMLQTARLKKIHNTLIFPTINIINALLAMHTLLDWQIGHVGIIDGYLGNFGIGISGAAAIGKLRALTIQILVTHVKSDLALMCSQFFLCRPILYLCKLHLFPCLRAHTCNYITMMRVGNRGEPRMLVKMLLVKIARLSLSGDWKIWVLQGQGSL